MRCQKCGAELEEGVLFCRECGNKVVGSNNPKIRFCRDCGAEIMEGAKFCTSCGAKLYIDFDEIEISPQASESNIRSDSPEQKGVLNETERQRLYGSHYKGPVKAHKKKKRGIWIAALLFLILLLLIVLPVSMKRTSRANNDRLVVKTNTNKRSDTVSSSSSTNSELAGTLQKTNYSIKKGTEYAYMPNEWNVYIATAISDSLIKIESWDKTFVTTKKLGYDHDVGTYKINDEENLFSWIDDDEIAFSFFLKDKSVSKLKKGKEVVFSIDTNDSDVCKGTNYDEAIVCYSFKNDDWHLYRAIPLTDSLIKIECWYRGTSVGNFLYGYDVVLIDTRSKETDFEWTDDEHTSFTITMQDPDNKYYWKKPSFTAFVQENKDSCKYASVKEFLYGPDSDSKPEPEPSHDSEVESLAEQEESIISEESKAESVPLETENTNSESNVVTVSSEVETSEETAIISETSAESTASVQVVVESVPEESSSRETTKYTCTSILNVRKKPSTEGKILKVLNAGDVIDVYAVENGWAEIEFNGKPAYVSEQFIQSGIITITPTPTSTPETTPTEDNAENANHGYNENDSKKDESVSYSTNDKSSVKDGNSGIYSYKSRGGSYSIYYIIDFDDGYVYRFTEGNGEESCDRLKIDSGNLNSVLIVTYHDGDDQWSNGLHFKYKNQPDHMILQDNFGFETDFYTTDLNGALKLKNTKKVVDY